MKLFTVKIPEIQQLPRSEREEIVKRCLQTAAIETFRKIASKVGSVLLSVGPVGFLLLAIFIFHWSLFPAIAAFLGLTILLLIVFFVLKMAVEVWLLRAAVRKEMTSASK